MLFDPKWQTPAHEVKTAEPWRKLLLKAADEIEKRGWCQRTGFDYAGRVCAAGALSIAAEGQPVFADCTSPDAGKAIRKLGDYLGTPYVATWNDAHGRTASEVISALRAAARK